MRTLAQAFCLFSCLAGTALADDSYATSASPVQMAYAIPVLTPGTFSAERTVILIPVADPVVSPSVSKTTLWDLDN